MTIEDAERYRRKAEECRANARTVTDDSDRAAWLRLAEVWMELARSANKDGGAPGNAEEEIKKRAYEIWDRDGRPKGKEDEFWQQAEQEVRNENLLSRPHGGIFGATEAWQGRGRSITCRSVCRSWRVLAATFRLRVSNANFALFRSAPIAWKPLLPGFEDRPTWPFGSVAVTVRGMCHARGALPVISRPHCRERFKCTSTARGCKGRPHDTV